MRGFVFLLAIATTAAVNTIKVNEHGLESSPAECIKKHCVSEGTKCILDSTCKKWSKCSDACGDSDMDCLEGCATKYSNSKTKSVIKCAQQNGCMPNSTRLLYSGPDDLAFQSWMRTYGVLDELVWALQVGTMSADQTEDYDHRKALWEATVKQVAEANANTSNTYVSEVNEFAAMSDDEFFATFANLPEQNETARENLEMLDLSAIETLASQDWTATLGPAKNQGQCGSCWAFATVGVIESANKRKTGKKVVLSEAQFINCDHTSYGCSGGFPDKALVYATQQGVCTQKSFKSCSSKCSSKVNIKSAFRVKAGESNMAKALSSHALSVSVNVCNDFKNYRSGIFNGDCVGRSNHAVVAVGFKSGIGGYWKIRNSWGTRWGENGHIRLAMGMRSSGSCNVAESLLYPTM